MIHFFRQDYFFPLVLLLVILAGFGLEMPGLGFQGDDWHMLWLFYRMGDLSPFFNLTRFSTQWALPGGDALAGAHPMAVVPAHPSSALAGRDEPVYLFKKIFRIRDEFPSGLFAVLYCLYPGFLMGYLPLTFLFQSFQPICLFLSFYFMVKWLKSTQANQHWQFILSLVLAAANLLLSEYFFLLELLRPLVIWLALRKREAANRLRLAWSSKNGNPT